jgi:ABC-type microcin C transport system permease subunit YejB
MLIYILKRFLFMIPMLLGITLISFLVITSPRASRALWGWK